MSTKQPQTMSGIPSYRRPLRASTNLAERLGVEPSEPFERLYGLAIRCITILPPLRKHIHELSVPLHLLYSVLDMFKLGSSNWARTSDPQINSLLLYQLSYRGINSTYNYTLTGFEPVNTAVRQCYAPTISAWPTP